MEDSAPRVSSRQPNRKPFAFLAPESIGRQQGPATPATVIPDRVRVHVLFRAVMSGKFEEWVRVALEPGRGSRRDSKQAREGLPQSAQPSASDCGKPFPLSCNLQLSALKTGKIPGKIRFFQQALPLFPPSFAHFRKPFKCLTLPPLVKKYTYGIFRGMSKKSIGLEALEGKRLRPQGRS